MRKLKMHVHTNTMAHQAHQENGNYEEVDDVLRTLEKYYGNLPIGISISDFLRLDNYVEDDLIEYYVKPRITDVLKKYVEKSGISRDPDEFVTRLMNSDDVKYVLGALRLIILEEILEVVADMIYKVFRGHQKEYREYFVNLIREGRISFHAKIYIQRISPYPYDIIVWINPMDPPDEVREYLDTLIDDAIRTILKRLEDRGIYIGKAK